MALSDIQRLKQFMGGYYQEPEDELILLEYLELYTYPTLAAHHLWNELPAQINVGSVRMFLSGSEQTTFHNFRDVLDFCQKQAKIYLDLYNASKKIGKSIAVGIKRAEW